MELIKNYWWLIIVLLLVGLLLNGIRDLKKMNYSRYIEKRKGMKRPSDDDEDNPISRS